MNRRQHHNDAEHLQHQSLGNGIRRKQLLNLQVAAAVFFQGFPHGLVALAGQVKGFDNAHALHLLQHSRLPACAADCLPLGSQHWTDFFSMAEVIHKYRTVPATTSKADAPVEQQHAIG